MCAEQDKDEVRPGLYLGCVKAERALQELQKSGITHIVQVGTGVFMEPTWPTNFEYRCISALDYEGEDLLTKLKDAKVHNFIDAAISSGGKVLVHCSAGVSRSATTVVSYIMSREHLSFEEALGQVMARRGCICPNRGFCNQLRILQDLCEGKLERYDAAMLMEREELSRREWLALMLRTRYPLMKSDSRQNDLSALGERKVLSQDNANGNLVSQATTSKSEPNSSTDSVVGIS